MPADRLDQLSQQALSIRTPVVGGWLRRRAAWRIWSRGSPDAMARLARLLSETSDLKLQAYILTLLGSISESHRVDAVIRVWSETRHATLGELLQRKRWLASEPLPLRVLSALWADLGPDMISAPPAGVSALLAAATDAEPTIATRAAEVLRRLSRSDSRQAVCDAFIDTGSEPAKVATQAAGYEPAVPARRAIFYFLTGQWSKYEALDFDGSALRAAYELAGSSLRQRLADVARRAGRMDYVSAVAREGRKVGELTDHEWESAVEVLAGGQRWKELWRLAQSAPPAWASRMLLRLIDAAPNTVGELSVGGQALSATDLVPAAHAWLDAGLASLPSPQRLDGHTGGVRAMTISADGSLCITTALGDRTVRIWSLADQHAMHRQAGDVTCLATSPDSRTLAIGAEDGSIQLWGVPEGRQIARLAAHVGAVRVMTTLPLVRTRGSAESTEYEGPALVSAGDDGRVRLFTLPIGHEIRSLGRPGDAPIVYLQADPQSGFIASADEVGIVRLWDPQRPGPDALWSSLVAGRPVGLAVADSGKTVAAAAKHSAIVRLFRCPVGRPSYESSPGGGDCTGLITPGNGRLICVAGEVGRATLIRAADGAVATPLQPPHDAAITAMASSEDGHLLATGDATGEVRLWGLPDGKLLAATKAGTSAVAHLAFAPNGGPLLAALMHDPAIRSWQVETLRLGRLPLGDMSLRDLQRTQQMAAGDPAGLASPFALIAALLSRRFEHDVIVEEATGRISAGEFDIELL